MNDKQRMEWQEMRGGELFFVYAQRTPQGWEFWERSCWESRYYRMAEPPRAFAPLGDRVMES